MGNCSSPSLKCFSCRCCSRNCTSCNLCQQNSIHPQSNDLTNLEIEYDLLQSQMNELTHFKILVLGAGESGKSTIIKQIRNIYNIKFTPKELRAYASSLAENVHDVIRSLVAALEKFDIRPDDDGDKKLIEEVSNGIDGPLNPDMAARYLKFWNSNAGKQCWERRSDFWILDAAPYYMENVERFSEENFLPNEEDCIMARIRTTGIITSNFTEGISDPKTKEQVLIDYQFIDVGGQRNERRKWINAFDDVKCILYVASLAGYDQILFEEESNRLDEDIHLFEDVVGKDIFRSTPLFLLLNKKDLFESMIRERPLSTRFDDFKEGDSLAPSMDYISQLFLSKCKLRINDIKVLPVSARARVDIKDMTKEVKMDLYNMNRAKIWEGTEKIKKLMNKLSLYKKNEDSL